MSGQALSMATGGIICKTEIFKRIILPFNVKLKNDKKNINITRTPIKTISLKEFNIGNNNTLSFNIHLKNAQKNINIKRSPIKTISLKRI